MAAGRRPGFAIMAVDSVMSDFTIRVSPRRVAAGPSASRSKLRAAYPSRHRAWPRGRAVSDQIPRCGALRSLDRLLSASPIVKFPAMSTRRRCV